MAVLEKVEPVRPAPDGACSGPARSGPHSARPARSPSLEERFLERGFQDRGPLLSGNQKIEDLRRPDDTFDVFGADSAQAQVLAEALQGQDLLVTAGPGAGKSLTIINLVANAAARGEKSLVVLPSASLETARRWLKRAGLEGLALILDGSPDTARKVSEDLETTLNLGRPVELPRDETIRRLMRAQDRMNLHAQTLASEFRNSGLTVYQILTQYLKMQESRHDGEFDFDSPEMRGWDSKTCERALQILANLELHLSTKGSPVTHLFNGVELSARELEESSGLRTQLAAAEESAKKAREAAQPLFAGLGLSDDLPGELLKSSADLLNYVADYYTEDGRYFESADFFSTTLERDAAAMRACVVAGKTLAPLRDSLLTRVKPEAFSAPNLGKIKELLEIEIGGTPKAERFAAEVGLAHELVKSLCTEGYVPGDAREMLTLVSEIMSAQALSSRIGAAQPLFQAVFGSRWVPSPANSPAFWNSLEFVVESGIRIHTALRNHPLSKQLIEIIRHPAALYELDDKGALKHALACLDQFLEQRRALAEALKLSGAAFRARFKEVSLIKQQQLLQDWNRGFELLPELCRYQEQYNVQAIPGLREIVQKAERWKLAGTSLVDAVRRSRLEGLVDDFLTFSPLAKQFDAALQSQYSQDLRAAELQFRRMNSTSVAAQHWDRLPRLNCGSFNELRKLLAAKPKTQSDLDRLFQNCAEAIVQIKPVILATPEGLRQLSRFTSPRFDRLICDEAGEFPFETAASAAKLCRQVVAFGDPAQKKSDDCMIDGLRRMGIAERQLPIHYRSLDGRMVDVSNHALYGGRLKTFPSPLRKMARARISALCPERTGTQEAGGTSQSEADRVCELVTAQAHSGSKKSLMVMTLSETQSELVREGLTARAQTDPVLSDFMSAGGPEPFVVRTVEQSRGDERDAAILSIGFDGRGEEGFGPLSAPHGDSTLNVAAFRAREQLIIVSSARPDDIPYSDETPAGAALLKRYLAAAADGEHVPPLEENTGLADPFQDAVRSALAKRGLEAVVNVGSHGLTVDIAVVHPDDHDRFILGILSDGRRAQEVQSARERELIYPDELRRRGWAVRQLSILEWLKNPEEIADDIAREVHSLRRRAPSESDSKPLILEPVELFRESSFNRADRVRALNPPYEKASIRSKAQGVLPARPELKQHVLSVAEKEAPVHQGQLSRRLAMAYGIEPENAILQEGIASALHELQQEGRLQRRAEFIHTRDADAAVLPRNRSALDAHLRKWQNVAPEERQAAILTIVRHSCGMAEEKLPAECWNLLGLSGDGAGFETVIAQDAVALQAAGAITADGKKLRL